MPAVDPHTPWPRAWTWAIALAMVLFGAHATTRWWLPALAQALCGDIPTPADAPPLAWAFLAGWIVLSLVGGSAIGSLVGEGRSVRDRHRWAHEQAERERQWALQRQLRELEQQIREERLPEEEREAIRERRRRDAEIRREARRRLGLPEEDEAHD
jgi:hypothetical protein